MEHDLDWDTFEKIQLCLKDNHAEYHHNKTRGIPRQGAALLQGIVYCGECSHKIFVQYKNIAYYQCNRLRQRYHMPICQSIPVKFIDSHIVEAFFQALSPVELDIYSQAISAKKETDIKLHKAHMQEIERLRYQAALAQRQFNKVDPENRLVASELESRWEESLRALKIAEKKLEDQEKLTNVVSFSLTAELKAAFSAIGQKIPQIWDKDILSQETKKALLRAIIDKVVIHRISRDQVQSRIVWKGGLTTTLIIPIRVNSLTELSNFSEMEKIIIQFTAEGKSDKEIAKYLNEKGYRSSKQSYILPTLVEYIRLKHRLLRKPSRSYPRIIAGYLTVSQLARTLNVPRNWIHDRIYNGTISINKDPNTGLLLFPDNPTTFEMFISLKNGTLNKLNFL